MIENAKQAKALGLSWIKLRVRHADGAFAELEGAFSRADANEILKAALEIEKRSPVPGDPKS